MRKIYILFWSLLLAGSARAQDFTFKNYTDHLSILQNGQGIKIIGNNITDNLGVYFLKASSNYQDSAHLAALYKLITDSVSNSGYVTHGYFNSHFAAATTIYNGDGTLTGNRLVTLGGYTLGFSGDIKINGLTVGLGAGNVASNAAFGTNALLSNTTGTFNTAIGKATLHTNTTGYYNTAVGNAALFTNSTGYGNTSVGYSAMGFNTTGTNDASLGVYALDNNTTGINNTAIGAESMAYNTTGSDNAALGYNTLFWNAGSQNVSIGSESGINLANRLTSVNNSTFVGYGANSSIDGISNSTALGNGAQVTASNQMVFGNSSVTSNSFNGTISITGTPVNPHDLVRLQDLPGGVIGGGGGTVTSIAATGANGILVSGASPVTTSGTFAFRADTAVLQTVSNFFPEGDTRYAKKSDTSSMLNNVVHKALAETITGAKTFTGASTFAQITGTNALFNNSSNRELQINNFTPAYTATDYATLGGAIGLSRPYDGNTTMNAVYSYDSPGTSLDNLAISSRSDIVFLGGSEMMRIKGGSSDVLVGTNVDNNNKLEVVNKGGGNTAVFRNADSTRYSSLFLYSDKDVVSRSLGLYYINANYAGTSMGYSGESAAITTGGAYPLFIGTANIASLSLFGNHHVAVNQVTDAGYWLDINGTLRVQGAITTNLTSSMIKVDGSGAIVAAVEGTDYLSPTSSLVPTLAANNVFTGNNTFNGVTAQWGQFKQSGNKNVYLNNMTPTWTPADYSSLGGSMGFGRPDDGNSNLNTIYEYNTSADNNNFAFTSRNDIVWLNVGTENMRLLTDGSLLLGTSTEANSSKLTVSSTTKGFLPPRMTTSQKTAISSPAEGLVVYDNTVHQLSYYNGGAWKNAVITDVNGNIVTPMKITTASGIEVFNTGTVTSSVPSPSSNWIYYTYGTDGTTTVHTATVSIDSNNNATVTL